MPRAPLAAPTKAFSRKTRLEHAGTEETSDWGLDIARQLTRDLARQEIFSENAYHNRWVSSLIVCPDIF
jgi:hypothetical protein